jgi:hypothetical protein
MIALIHNLDNHYHHKANTSITVTTQQELPSLSPHNKHIHRRRSISNNINNYPTKNSHKQSQMTTNNLKQRRQLQFPVINFIQIGRIGKDNIQENRLQDNIIPHNQTQARYSKHKRAQFSQAY